MEAEDYYNRHKWSVKTPEPDQEPTVSTPRVVTVKTKTYGDVMLDDNYINVIASYHPDSGEVLKELRDYVLKTMK